MLFLQPCRSPYLEQAAAQHLIHLHMCQMNAADMHAQVRHHKDWAEVRCADLVGHVDLVAELCFVGWFAAELVTQHAASLP